MRKHVDSSTLTRIDVTVNSLKRLMLTTLTW